MPIRTVSVHFNMGGFEFKACMLALDSTESVLILGNITDNVICHLAADQARQIRDTLNRHLEEMAASAETAHA